MRTRALEISNEELGALCRKWRINRLALFGSALSDELRPDSDVDLLVDFERGERWSLMDLVRAEEEFAVLFGRHVDLVDRSSLQRSRNWIRREAILGTAEVIYDA
ncbi:MAG: nucleotidyltransferase domain-containing protein [Chloroflexi bacterium]|nr:nucleotidyltransferase domain-containing protein [Chloroflexota bacterium]